MLVRLLVAALVLLLFVWLLQRRSAFVPAEEAKRLVAQGALLVDVRSPEEFTSGHLDGARNIPVQVLGQRLQELGPRERPVVLYCRSGMRSANAAAALRAAGFTAVYNLGPMSRWVS